MPWRCLLLGVLCAGVEEEEEEGEAAAVVDGAATGVLEPEGGVIWYPRPCNC